MAKEETKPQAAPTNNGERLISFAQWFSMSRALMKSHFTKLLQVLTIPIVLYASQFVTSYFTDPVTFGVMDWVSIGLALVAWVAMTFAGIAAVKVLQDETITVGQAYSAASKLFFPAWWIAILTWVVTAGASIPLIVPGIIISFSVAFAGYSLIIENRRGLTAMVRSWDLVRDRLGGVVGRLFSSALLLWIIPFVILGLIVAVAGPETSSTLAVADATPTEYAISALVFLVGLIFVLLYAMPLSVTLSYVLYADLQKSRPAAQFEESQKKRKQYRRLGIWGIIASILLIVLVLIVLPFLVLFLAFGGGFGGGSFDERDFDPSVFEGFENEIQLDGSVFDSSAPKPAFDDPQVTARARDAKRLSDINSLQLALELYLNTSGTYPVTQGRETIVPTSSTSLDLIVAANILGEIPNDPNTDQGWFYTYQSDGVSYSLSARMEDESRGQQLDICDPEVLDMCLYRVGVGL